MQLIGEGYQEEVILDNLPTAGSFNLINADQDQEASDLLTDEDLNALKSNLIHFGDCYVNERKQLLFTMKNMSKTQCYRFEWQQLTHQGTISIDGSTSSNSMIQFSPRVGHLHAGCAKDITVSFKSSETRFLRNELVQCFLTKISFNQPIDEVKFFFFSN